MNRYDLREKATRAAERVIRERGLSRLPVDPIAIARGLDIEVKAMPSDIPGVSGMLLRDGSSFAITYSTFIKSVGFQHFSVAHELGHYFLPGHIDAVIGSDGTHRSHGGFLSEDHFETEADHFAAGLLMPRSLLTSAMRNAGCGLQAIKGLAEVCRTWLTATAIRFTEFSEDAVAIVCSTGDKINYCFMSESLKEGGVPWLRKGQRLPSASATLEFNRDEQRVSRGETEEDASDLQDWFGGDISSPVTEEIVGLGRYGKTLTVLTAPELIQSMEGMREDAELRDSWRPKFEL